MIKYKIAYWITAIICIAVSLNNIMSQPENITPPNMEIVKEIVSYDRETNEYLLTTVNLITNKNKKELGQKLEGFDLCRKLGSKYFDAVRETLDSSIENQNIFKIKSNMNKIKWEKNNDLGNIMYNFDCKTGTIIWLSYKKSETARLIETIIDTKINEIKKG